MHESMRTEVLHRCLHTRRTRRSTCHRASAGGDSSDTVGSSSVALLAWRIPSLGFDEVWAWVVELAAADDGLQTEHGLRAVEEGGWR